LYIPCGWWHYLAADELTVSVNAWHGASLSNSAKRSAFLTAGAAVQLRTLRDLVVFGLLGKPFAQRPFSPPPLGYTVSRRGRGRARVSNKQSLAVAPDSEQEAML
jgi:hypothetical protein